MQLRSSQGGKRLGKREKGQGQDTRLEFAPLGSSTRRSGLTSYLYHTQVPCDQMQLSPGGRGLRRFVATCRVFRSFYGVKRLQAGEAAVSRKGDMNPNDDREQG